MKENLEKYLRSLFLNARDTAQNSALFEELLGNLCDRYDELIAEGADPADAYAKAIGELGDIGPLIEKNDPVPPVNGGERIFKEEAETRKAPPNLGKKKQLTAEELCRAKHTRGLSIAVAVMLYILWLVPTVLFEWGFVFLFICVAAGTVILVLSSNTIPPYVDDSALTYSVELRERCAKRAHILMAFGIGLCILCVLPAALLDSDWGAALMFLIVALGVGMIIYASATAPGLDKLAESTAYVPLDHKNPPERYEKKKNHWLLPVVLCAAVAVVVSGIWGGINGIRFGIFSIEGKPLALYVNEGDATIETDLKHLTIDWTAGSVTVEPYDGDKIEIFETQNGQPVESGKNRMRWYEENGDLYIRFDGYSDIRFFVGTQPQKDLTVRIPADDVLQGVRAEMISAIFAMSNIVVNEAEGVVDIDTVSGGTLLQNVTAGGLDFSGVSAVLTVNTCTLTTLEAESVSGNVMLQSSTIGRVELDSTSGGLKSAGCIHGALELDTTSGDVSLDCTSTLKTVVFDTISGDMHLYLSSDVIGFTARLDSTSGDFECSFATTAKDGARLYGDGSLKIEMDSTSGNLVIMAK